MKKKEKATLRCIRCDHEFETEIWTAIDVSDEDLSHKIFTDQINVFTCEKCGNCGATEFPLQVRDSKARQEALVMPLYQPDKPEYDESNPAFSVVEIQKKRPCKMYYDLSELKFEIHRWSGEPFIPFEAPPDEKDIEEGLAKGFITEKEGAELRDGNWDSIHAKILEQGLGEKKPVELEDEEDYLFELYFALMTQLKRSRTVVELKR
jgi:predicted nucleic-acid-binding Zn-ribbon protein